MADARYPWYSVVRGNELAQGDLLRGCPQFVVPADAHRADEVVFTRETVDALVLTQSCNLVLRADGTCEATDVLLCAIYFKNELEHHTIFGKWQSWEET